jgi:hypothetical protein
MMNCISKALKEKPLNRRNILHHYLPLAGSISYAGLGVSVIQPGILRRSVSVERPYLYISLESGGI